jgi:acetylornithine deacetylase/succinyl-diaminopimelate desuccinylase-like protein
MSMLSSVQKKLLNYADEHFLSYYETWKRSRMAVIHSNVFSERTLAWETLLSQFRQYGIEPQLLGADHPLLYGERHKDAFSTLLFYYPYDRAAAPLQQAEAFASCLAALDLYEQVTGSLPINIKWLFDGATEAALSEAELERLLAEHRELLQADGCLSWTAQATGSTSPFLALGSKGLLCVELAVQTLSTPFPSRYGAILPNAAWRLTWALSSLKSPGEEVLIEGFYETLTPAEDNEVELISVLAESMLVPQREAAHMLLGLRGTQVNYVLLLIPTCTINAIHSGTIAQVQPAYRAYPHTLMPAQAKAQVDFHLVPGQQPHDIFSKLERHLQTQGFQDIQVHLLHESLPSRTSMNDPFAQSVLQAARTAYGSALPILPLTDTNYPLAPFRQVLGLPVVLMGMGDEHRYRDNFLISIKFINLLTEELARHAIDRN